ncbi:MAG: type II toxin-antitoxin system prevent-host-death family antitoxin [Candidatus Nanopelagicales bacterium]|nr:type II toxin-antitoxin system prevent-host-death family antitoxin [Candidatus Nanopelagicales bacterium]MDZ4248985.1 type II toxin-antitoxin system prevent-host-death family antitoxin [Candidatus Nanopelagicales bacterium]
MQIVNMHDAKTHLSQLIARAIEFGEPFIIAKSGRPLVKIVPLDAEEQRTASYRIGFMKGKLKYPEDAEELMHLGDPEVAEMFGEST